MVGIYLGLGTNLGDRLSNLNQCLGELKSHCGLQLIEISSIYETEPYGIADQPYFYNLVVEIDTHLDPFRLLKTIQQLEKKIGRFETYRWGPRVIDIDILSYHNIIIEHTELIIPHKQLHLRRFVLIPLREIAGQFLHPKLKKTIEQMLIECQDSGQIKLVIQREKILKRLI